MKSRFFNSTLIAATLLAAGVTTFDARANEWDRMTILNVNQTIQVKDTVLEPGRYIFRLADTSDRHVVQIFKNDRTHIVATVMTIPGYRRDPGDTQFTFWETPAAAARALRASYYPGESIGQEFTYPRKPLMLQAALRPVLAANTEAAPAAFESAPVQPADSFALAPAETQPVEEAQNTPPAPPAAEAPATTPADTQAAPEKQSSGQESNRLPDTGSKYPLIGLAGLLSFGLYGILRVKHS